MGKWKEIHETKGDAYNSKSYNSARTWIQADAKRVYEQTQRPTACFFCGYSKHVDVAHRRAASSFPMEAKISEINSPDNLIALCPNHHREADSGMIDLLALSELEAIFGYRGFLRINDHGELERKSKRRNLQGCLMLSKKVNAASTWYLRYQHNGNLKSMRLGSLDLFPTKERAREVANLIRKAVPGDFAETIGVGVRSASYLTYVTKNKEVIGQTPFFEARYL